MPIPILTQSKTRNRSQITLNSQVMTLLLATGAGVGVFLGIRAVTKNFKKGIRERQALSPGNPAAIASQFKLAFENDSAFGWGTDEEAVFQLIERIPNGTTFRRVQNAYRDLYGSNLSADLKSELSSNEYNQLLDSIRRKFSS